MTQSKNKTLTSNSPEFWNDRYKKEGSIWGEEPSLTALKAQSLLPHGSKILVVGFGYGRELVYLSKMGYAVGGVESSGEACRIATEKMTAQRIPCHKLVHSSFESQTDYTVANFDAIVSHRVLHLITNEELIKRWVEMSGKLLKEGGKIFIGNRSVLNEKNGSVNKIEGKIFQDSGRPGHLINLWKKEDYIKYFGENFENFIFEESSEPETLGSETECNILLISATKKYKEKPKEK